MWKYPIGTSLEGWPAEQHIMHRGSLQKSRNVYNYIKCLWRAITSMTQITYIYVLYIIMYIIMLLGVINSNFFSVGLIKKLKIKKAKQRKLCPICSQKV